MSQPGIREVSPYNTQLKLKGFNAYRIDHDSNATRIYSRKDFYKICLNAGRNRIHYADRSFETDGDILFFGNPHIPYSWETLSPVFGGYACLFSEDFLKGTDRSESLQQSPLFRIGGTPLFRLDPDQAGFIATMFRKMIAEQQTSYAFKGELIRNYVQLIIHEALKLQPADSYDARNNAASRLTAVFFDLLERQFPIESTDRALRLRTPGDFARNLSVHVNHLNRAVREVTGRPTTAHIAERIIAEARALLLHTEWNIADIAYALGFRYPAYFNNYFKRLTGQNPGSLRSRKV